MKLRDLLDILETDSVRIYCGYTMEVEVGDPYIEMACKEYMDREVEWIRPLNDAVEITIKETQSEKRYGNLQIECGICRRLRLSNGKTLTSAKILTTSER